MGAIYSDKHLITMKFFKLSFALNSGVYLVNSLVSLAFLILAFINIEKDNAFMLFLFFLASEAFGIVQLIYNLNHAENNDWKFNAAKLINLVIITVFIVLSLKYLA